MKLLNNKANFGEYEKRHLTAIRSACLRRVMLVVLCGWFWHDAVK